MIEKLTGKPGGIVALPRHVVGFVRWRLIRAFLRKYGSPRLHELYTAADLWARESGELITWIGRGEARSSTPFDRTNQTGDSPGPRIFPDFFDMESESLDFLTALVLDSSPTLVVETGVANGASTAAILAAMNRVGRGRLHSVDVNPRVRDSVSAEDGRWELHITDGRVDSLHEVVCRLGPLDVFIHDSDHSYRHQLREYELGFSRLRAGGVLVSDDIDWTYAWLDFTKKHRLPFAVLLDSRKCLGVAVKR